MKIIGIGNALVDVLTQLEDDRLLEGARTSARQMQLVDAERAAQIQEKSKNLKKTMASGGSVPNHSRIGQTGNGNRFIGCVGKDETGRFLKKI